MDINIEQLDSEEKSKIRDLVRERNDKDRNKGVEYIFRQHEDKEQYLLGKKLDFNQMAKDDKALMGESEAEFNERMERRKMMQKMREDPISIIHFNDAQARKIAMEKKMVHEKFKDKLKVRKRRMSSSSDSDLDDSALLDKLKEIINKGEQNSLKDYIESNKIPDMHPNRTLERERSRSNNFSRQRESRDYRGMRLNRKITNDEEYSRNVRTSPHINRINPNHRSRSRSTKRRNKSRSLEKRKRSRSIDRRKKSRSNEKRKRSRSNEKSKRSLSNERRKRSRSNERRKRSRSNDKRKRSLSHDRKRSRTPKTNSKQYFNDKYKSNYLKPPQKSKLSEEEKKRRIEEMEQNAKEHELRCNLLDKKFQRDNEREQKEMEKQMKNHDLIVLNKSIKMGQNFSLEQCLDENRKSSMVKKVFKK